MGNAISTCFKKYATFTGRATRSEFWFFALFTFIVQLLANAIGIAAGSEAIIWLVYLVFFIPSISVTVRRMHDVDKSGWFQLIPIYSFILAVTAGTSGSNRFGDVE
jgi:uncharacterized membrane protein YhaH (DUF805 family)